MSRSVSSLIALLVLAAGCGAKTGEAVDQDQWFGADERIEAERGDVLEALNELRVNIDDIKFGQRLDENDVVASLKYLADGLTSMSSASVAEEEVRQIIDYTNRIAQSESRSVEQSAWMKSALEAGARALAAIAQEERLPPNLQSVWTAIAEIQDDQPLTRQTEALASALEQTADVLARLHRGQDEEVGTR